MDSELSVKNEQGQPVDLSPYDLAKAAIALVPSKSFLQSQTIWGMALFDLIVIGEWLAGGDPLTSVSGVLKGLLVLSGLVAGNVSVAKGRKDAVTPIEFRLPTKPVNDES